MRTGSQIIVFAIMAMALAGCGLADSHTDKGASEEAGESTTASEGRLQLQWEPNGEGILVAKDDGFPARALDPVLVVGEVELREYAYREGDQLLFLAQDPVGLSGEVQFGWAQGDEIYELEPTGYRLVDGSLEFVGLEE